MNNPHNLKVGQTLFIVGVISPFRMGPQNLQEVKISKIGTKYFAIERLYRRRFLLKNLSHDAYESSCCYQCYLTKQEVLDEREFSELGSKIRRVFTNFGKTSLSLNSLRIINRII